MIRFGSSVIFLTIVCLTLGQAEKASAQTSGWLQSDQTGKVEKSELEQIYVVNTRALNFRGEPSVDNAPLRSLAKGAFLKKLDETINSVERRTWYRVIWKTGEEGWVASEYLTPVSDTLWMVEGAAKFADSLASPTVASATLPALDDIRAGFLYVGPIGDAGWTYAHEKGRQAMAELPYVTAATYVESVPGDPGSGPGGDR